MSGSSNKMLASSPQIAQNSATHASCAVTVTAPTKPNQAIYLDGVIISASAAPAATVEATIVGVNVAGASGTLKLELPASAFAPIGFGFGTHPLPCIASTNLVVTVPDLGSGVICSVIVLYHIDGL